MPKKPLAILFIGNSHTYCNDLPLLVRQRAAEAGCDCRVTMTAHGNWFLSQHAEEPETRFNILHGCYDYVVLQEPAHPFGPETRFREAVLRLNAMIRQAGSTPVLYEIWARRDEPEAQTQINEAHRRLADEIGALIAPVGENWLHSRQDPPTRAFYADDGAHASPAGTAFAAGVIWETIWKDLERHVGDSGT